MFETPRKFAAGLLLVTVGGAVTGIAIKSCEGGEPLAELRTPPQPTSPALSRSEIVRNMLVAVDANRPDTQKLIHWDGQPELVVNRGLQAVCERYAGYSAEQQAAIGAWVVAVVIRESGCDLYAKNGNAKGPYQIMPPICKALGYDLDDRCDPIVAPQIVMDILRENQRFVDRREPSDWQEWCHWQYALYHDGPRLNDIGEELARDFVVPMSVWLYPQVLAWIQAD